MLESLTDQDRFTWWFPLCAAGCAAITFFPLTISGSDLAAMFYVFATVPVVSFVLLRIAFRRKGGQRLAAVSTFTVFVVFTAILFTRFTDIRNACRWLTYARVFKAEVLSGSGTGGGQLRHAEWEGWGFPGAGDTVVYLVFDPNDSLAAAAKNRSPGKFSGLPCEVFRVRRLENKWYTVQFYTDTDWNQCGAGG